MRHEEVVKRVRGECHHVLSKVVQECGATHGAIRSVARPTEFRSSSTLSTPAYLLLSPLAYTGDGFSFDELDM